MDKIFSRLSSHMIRGLMMHNDFAIMFDFLNLRGYRKEQERHYFEESFNYRCLNNFYLEHYNKLIVEDKVDNPKLIPSLWFKYTRMDVDASEKRNAIRDIYKEWVNWETKTKELYESCYKELYDLGEVAAAMYVARLIEDVSEELAGAQAKFLDLEAHGYDMVTIIDEQPRLYAQKLTIEDDEND